MSLDTLKTARPEDQQVEPHVRPEVRPVDRPLDENLLDQRPLDEVAGELVVPDDVSSLVELPKEKSLEKYVNPESPDAEPLRFAMANLEGNLTSEARHAAHEELAKIDKTGPVWRRFAKSVWHTMTREYQIVKLTAQKRQELIDNKNLRHHYGKSDQPWREAVIKRYTSDFGEKLIHAESGETFVKLTAEDAEHDDEVATIREDVFKLVGDFAKGLLDEDSFTPAQVRMYEKWKKEGVAQQYIGEGKFLAENLLPMARQVKAALDARKGLEDIDESEALKEMFSNAEIIFGNAKVGARTEIKGRLSERMAEGLSERLGEKLSKVPFISEKNIARAAAFVGNEVFIAAMLSAATYGGQRAMAGVVPGVGAGVVAAVRERRAMLDERALMFRRLDAGQGVDTENKAQAEIAETLYEAAKSSVLIEQLRGLYDEKGELKLNSREDLEAALQLQGDIRARSMIDVRQGLQDRSGARLIDFTEGDSDTSGDRLFLLDAALAKLEEDLKRCFTDPDMAVKLEIDPDEEYEKMLKANTDVALRAYSRETLEQDERFDNKVWSRGFKRFALVVVTSVVTHAVVDQVADHATNVAHKVMGWFNKLSFERSNTAPLLEPMAFAETVSPAWDTETTGPVGATGVGGEGGPVNATGVGGESGPVNATGVGGESGPVNAKGVGGENAPVNATGVGGEKGGPVGATGVGGEGGPVGATGVGGEILTDGKTLDINKNTKVTLPEGYKVTPQGESVTIESPSGKTFNLDLNKDGSISEDSAQDLRDRGFQIFDQSGRVEGEPKVTHDTVKAREFVDNHKHEMVKISHESWYHNNTRAYDLNELRLDNALRKDGSILISIDRMLGDDSFKGSEHVDWKQAAKDGKLMVYLSASEGTQGRAFEIPMNENGRLIIANDHPARALFNENGKFIGGFQEVSIKGGLTEDGKTKIATMATVVGRGGPTFEDTIKTPTFEETHHYTVKPPDEIETSAATAPIEDRDYGFAVPVYGRRRLGEALPEETPPTPTPTPNLQPQLPSAPERLALTSAEVESDTDAAAAIAPAAAATSSGGAADTTTTRQRQQRTATNGGSFGDNTTDNKDKAKNTGSYDQDKYSNAERVAFERIAQSKLNVPLGFRVNLENLSTIPRNIAIALMVEVVSRTPRRGPKPSTKGKPEPLVLYRARVAAAMQKRASEMISQLGAVSTPTARAIFEEAFNAVLTVTPEAPQNRR